MNQQKDVPTQDAVKSTDELVAEYLTKNPQLASALATFDVAQEEYRKSLLAMTSVRLVTSGTANLEA
jgi:hypothetical protein